MSGRSKQLTVIAPCLIALSALVAGSTGCSKAPDNAENVRRLLYQTANLKNIKVTDDHTKGVVTLSGNVATEADKAQALAIAKTAAGNEVVSNEVAVVPPGFENQAKTVNSDIDKGINENLDAALIRQNMHQGITYTVKNGVVTLTGDVRSQEMRSQVQNVASRVPNVQQVVNELQVKNQRASSSN